MYCSNSNQFRPKQNVQKVPHITFNVYMLFEEMWYIGDHSVISWLEKLIEKIIGTNGTGPFTKASDSESFWNGNGWYVLSTGYTLYKNLSISMYKCFL